MERSQKSSLLRIIVCGVADGKTVGIHVGGRQLIELQSGNGFDREWLLDAIAEVVNAAAATSERLGKRRYPRKPFFRSDAEDLVEKLLGPSV